MVLEGLTFEQYREIVNFVLKYHRFGHINKENNFPAKYSIKYIDNCFDTRTLTIWSVSFRGFGTTFRNSLKRNLSVFRRESMSK